MRTGRRTAAPISNADIQATAKTLVRTRGAGALAEAARERASFAARGMPEHVLFWDAVQKAIAAWVPS